MLSLLVNLSSRLRKRTTSWRQSHVGQRRTSANLWHHLNSYQESLPENHHLVIPPVTLCLAFRSFLIKRPDWQVEQSLIRSFVHSASSPATGHTSFIPPEHSLISTALPSTCSTPSRRGILYTFSFSNSCSVTKFPLGRSHPTETARTAT